MTFPFFSGRSTVRQLHRAVQQSLVRQHAAGFIRRESTKSTSASNASTAASDVANATIKKSTRSTGANWAWLEPVKIPFRAYSAMQKRRPLVTQWETSVVIYFLGDLAAQTVQSDFYSESPYEPIRGLRAMVIGGILSIPSYKWFLWLGRNFNYSTHVVNLGIKIAISQCLFQPIFSSTFFGLQSLLSGNSLQQTWDRIKITVPVSWKNSWKLWPAVTAFSFTYISPHNRSVFAGGVAVFWQTYLSWLNRQAELAQQEKLAGSIAALPAMATSTPNVAEVRASSKTPQALTT